MVDGALAVVCSRRCRMREGRGAKDACMRERQRCSSIRGPARPRGGIQTTQTRGGLPHLWRWLHLRLWSWQRCCCSCWLRPPWWRPGRCPTACAGLDRSKPWDAVQCMGQCAGRGLVHRRLPRLILTALPELRRRQPAPGTQRTWQLAISALQQVGSARRPAGTGGEVPPVPTTRLQQPAPAERHTGAPWRPS